MLVAIAYHRGDALLAYRLLEWVRDLDGWLPNHSLLLLASYDVDQQTFDRMKDMGRKVFGKVHLAKRANPEPTGWPQAPNVMFQSTVRHVHRQIRQPFLWMEADATPLRTGWLDLIEAEYRRGKKPFMGTVFEWVSAHRRLPHLNGVAVYPVDVGRFNTPVMFARELPWDTVRPELTLGAAHITPLFHHTPGDPPFDKAWTFPDAKSLERIRPDAVIFHRCKDGSLIERLRETRGTRSDKSSDTCVICLGRYGDIMNALPIARDISLREGRPVRFMAAQQFASVLDGCSYVVPQIYSGEYNEMPHATSIAKATNRRVVRAQIFSTPEAKPGSGYPHNKFAWRLAKYERMWNHPRMQLVFDKRDKRRERKLLLETVQRQPKPILLVSLTSGHSGPFKDGAELRDKIYRRYTGQFQIIDLSPIRAHRIYDLLGLMELAAGMVTIDTATMHLAAACMRLPVLMLAPDDLYAAAHPRCNCERIVRYGNWRAEEETIMAWIGGKAAQPKIVHCYETHQGVSDRAKRAQASWVVLRAAGWIDRPFGEPYPRDSRSIGDVRGVPYVNDVLAHGLATPGLSDMDIVVFTNDDITLLTGVHNDILSCLARVPGMVSSRRDIQQFSDATPKPPIEKHWHCGRDLVACRVWFLRKMLAEMPPIFLGTNDWDNVVINFMRRECGVLVVGQWSWEASYTITDCELASGNVLHEMHTAKADTPEFANGAANLWNRSKLVEWGKAHCPDLAFPWAENAKKMVEKTGFKFEPFAPSDKKTTKRLQWRLPWSWKETEVRT